MRESSILDHFFATFLFFISLRLRFEWSGTDDRRYLLNAFRREETKIGLVRTDNDSAKSPREEEEYRSSLTFQSCSIGLWEDCTVWGNEVHRKASVRFVEPKIVPSKPRELRMNWGSIARSGKGFDRQCTVSNKVWVRIFWYTDKTCVPLQPTCESPLDSSSCLFLYSQYDLVSCRLRNDWSRALSIAIDEPNITFVMKGKYVAKREIRERFLRTINTNEFFDDCFNTSCSCPNRS